MAVVTMEQHQDTATAAYFINNDSNSQRVLPSFSVEAAVPFDFDEWSKKSANAEYPYTPYVCSQYTHHPMNLPNL